MSQLQQPVMYFNDLNGSPLDNGSLYFGAVNLNPETSPIVVYWDSALTQIAAQPVKTSNGRPVRNGTIAALFAGSDFSLTVKNKTGALVYYAPKSADVYSAFTQSLLAAPDAATARTVLGAVAKIGDTMSGDLVLNNTTTNTPNVKFIDPVNNTASYWDENLERARLMTSYRGGAETERIGVNANTGEIAINGSAGEAGMVLRSGGAGAGAAWGSAGVGVGLRNKLINGAMSIDYIKGPLGLTTVVTPATPDYVVNRWKLSCTGAGASVSALRSGAFPSFSIPITASSNISTATLTQRISYNACGDMVGAVCTLQASLRGDASALPITWVISAPSTATDDFSSTTVVASGTFTGVTGTASVVSATFTGTAACAKGVQVSISCGAMTTGASFSIGNVQLEVGATPSPIEMRDTVLERMMCEAYMPSWGGPPGTGINDSIGVGAYQTATTGYIMLATSAKLNRRITAATFQASQLELFEAGAPTLAASATFALVQGGRNGLIFSFNGVTGRTVGRAIIAVLNDGFLIYGNAEL